MPLVRIGSAVLLFVACGAPKSAFAEGTQPTASAGEHALLPILQMHTLCAEAPSLWSRARSRLSPAYCFLVQRSRSLVLTAPPEALELAEQAMTLEPRGAEARRAAAEAHLFSGDPELAHQLLHPFSHPVNRVTRRHLKGTVLAAPTARDLIVQARSALLSGHYQDALGAYRSAVLRLDELGRPHEQARVLVEAATAAAYASPALGRESRTYLAAAKGKNAPLLAHIVNAAWALSLFRDGQIESSKVQVDYLQSSWQVRWLFDGQRQSLGLPDEILPALPPGESAALAAVVAEAVEHPATSIHWNEFSASAGEQVPIHLRRSGP